MAIAHVCMSCGFDLARVRVQREPHYQLPLVICPRCTTACVRRTHPIWERFHRLRRLDCVLSVLLAQVILIAFFSFAMTLASFTMVMLALDVPRFSAEQIRWMLIAIAGFAPFLGMWLTVAFHHLPRRRVWLGWSVYALLLMLWVGMALYNNDEFAIADGLGLGQSALGLAAQGIVSIALFVVVSLLPVAIIMLLAITGIPFGRMILWLFRIIARHRWRWRRRMARRARST